MTYIPFPAQRSRRLARTSALTLAGAGLVAIVAAAGCSSTSEPAAVSPSVATPVTQSWMLAGYVAGAHAASDAAQLVVVSTAAQIGGHQ